MKKVPTSHIPKLNGDNYQQWKLQMSLALQAAGVWGVVDSSLRKPTLKSDGSNKKEVDEWEEKDVGARSLIVQLLEPRQMSHVYSCSTAKILWDKIKQINPMRALSTNSIH
jgi:hypothetical protein